MQSRRGFLAASGTLSTVAVAGCSGILGGDGDGDGNGVSAGGRYTELVAETDERPVSVNLQKINELAANENFAGIGEDDAFLGLDPTEAEYAVNVTEGAAGLQASTYSIIFGPFVFEDVRSELEAQVGELSEIEETNGFRTLEAESGGQAIYYGVSDEAFLFGTDRTLFDRGTELVAGDGSTLFDSNDDLDNLAGIIGDPTLGEAQLEPEQLQTDPTGNAVAAAAGIELGDEESDYTSGITYETEEEATENESAVGDAVVETESAIDSVETEVDGRTVIVTATATTAELGPQGA